jgi:hypothetical protein
MGEIIRQYETLRLSGAVPGATRAALRVQGDEFELVQDKNTIPSLRRVQHAKHVVEDDRTTSWILSNRFTRQMPQIRIEALMSAAPYDSPDAVPLADFEKAGEFAEKSGQTGVVATFDPVSEPTKDGLHSVAFEAKSEHPEPESAWALAGKTFPSLMNLADRALGVWIYGDGQGEILNIQLKNPAHINSAISDHYITVDFIGWQYRLLVEPESDRIGYFGWPYSSRQNIRGNKPLPFGDVLLDYNLWVDYGHISALNVFQPSRKQDDPLRAESHPRPAVKACRNRQPRHHCCRQDACVSSCAQERTVHRVWFHDGLCSVRRQRGAR